MPDYDINAANWILINQSKGVNKPLIHQSEFRHESSPFSRKKFLSLCSIVKTTEWNGLIKIDNWS